MSEEIVKQNQGGGGGLTLNVNNAIKSPLVSDSPEEDIRKALAFVFVLIGLREPPEGVAKTILINHIKSYMQNYRIDEFKVAFEMVVNGTIDVDVEHYGNFNTAYLAKIMQAYKRQTQKLIAKPKEKPLSPKEKRDIIIKGILYALELAKDGVWITDTGSPKYNYLEVYKIIKTPMIRKKAILKDAKAKYLEECRMKMITKPKTKDIIKEDIKSIVGDSMSKDTKAVIISYAKEMALNEFFQNCVRTKFDLAEQLKY